MATEMTEAEYAKVATQTPRVTIKPCPNPTCVNGRNTSVNRVKPLYAGDDYTVHPHCTTCDSLGVVRVRG
jgi:hypothetical protein